jgi:glutaryl-CoA dehydrogenase
LHGCGAQNTSKSQVIRDPFPKSDTIQMLGSIARKRLFNGKARRFSSIRPNHDPPPALPNAFGGTYDWEDPFRLEESLTEEERMLKHAARGFCEGELFPGIIKANRKEITLDHNLMQKMGECGFLGCTLPEKYGGCDFGYVSYGLMAAEIEMVDSSYRSAMSVQSSLVMYPIANYASNEKLKLKYLPELAAGRMIGCFGLTEPNHGR